MRRTSSSRRSLSRAGAISSAKKGLPPDKAASLQQRRARQPQSAARLDDPSESRSGQRPDVHAHDGIGGEAEQAAGAVCPDRAEE